MKKRAAVIGSPISHSLSPVLFSVMTRQMGLSEFKYAAVDVPPEGLDYFLKRLRQDASTVGINVTIPHKQKIMALLDEVAPEAQAIGAVNVVQNRGGRLLGFNTDVVGIEETLAAQKCKIAQKNALLIGAGGAARAMAYVLGKQGAKNVFIQNRETTKAKQLVDDFQKIFPATRFVAIADTSEVRSERMTLVVNATSVGMKRSTPSIVEGTTVPTEMFFELLMKDVLFTPDALAFDLIYNPEQTLFLNESTKLGLWTVGGIDMLIDQARAALPRFLEVNHPSELRPKLRAALRFHFSEKPVFLTGFMGSGKSTVGHELARMLNWAFVDTDHLIEEKAQKTVAQIFQDQGESAFRELENQVIGEVIGLKQTVIALGGGSLLNPENGKRVEKSGHVVYLQASIDTLEKRLEGSTARPLVTSFRDRVQALLDARMPGYEKAHFAIPTDGLNLEAVALSVLEKVAPP